MSDLRRHFKSPQIRPWQQPSPRANLLELIDEAFTIGSGVKLRIQVLTKLGQRASSYRVQQSIQQWIGRAGYRRVFTAITTGQRKRWWYFLDHPEVPPDNNLAERSLRLAVTKRKVGGVTLNGQVRSDS